jgi:hypothetical protein
MVMVMAKNLLTFIRTKKLTTGLSKMAMITAKMSGTIILWATYKMDNNATIPTKKMLALA